MTQQTRRRFLRWGVSGGVAGLAGFLGHQVEKRPRDTYSGGIGDKDRASHDPGGRAQSARQSTSEQAPTTLAEGVTEKDAFDISDADDAGRLHVAYSKDRELYYARTTTDGSVETTQQVDVMANAIAEVYVQPEPDGHAHVIYSSTPKSRRGIGRAKVLKRAIIDSEAELVATGTLKDVSDSDSYGWLGLFDVLLVGNRVLVAVKDSPQGPNAEAQLFQIDTRRQVWTTRTLDIPAQYGVTDGIGLAKHGERVYLAYAYGRKLAGAGKLGLLTFRRAGSDLSRTDKIEFDSQGTAENWQLPDVEVDERGRPTIAHAGGPKGTLDWSKVVVVDQDATGMATTVYRSDPPEQSWHADLLFDEGGRLFVALRDQYQVYTPEFHLERQERPQLTGMEMGLTDEGSPGLVGLSDGSELVYKPLV